MGRPNASIFLTAFFAVASVGADVGSASAVSAQPPSGPCSTSGSARPRLVPVDEGARQRSFADFRAQLRQTVAHKDETALLAIVDPTVRTTFGDGGGIEEFRKNVREQRDAFWDDLSSVLRLGGSFTQPDLFAAPYVFSNWPDGFDSFECLAVIGTAVRLRERPDLDARVLTLLDHAIVQALDAEPPQTAAGWRRVRTADGRTGFVSRRYLRSPVAHRALFARKNERWWLVAYVAGD